MIGALLEIDRRSLAAFRISLAFILIKQHLDRLYLFFSYLSAPEFLLIGLGLMGAAMLFLGLHTRLAVFISWAVLAAFKWSGAHLFYPMDRVTHTLLFWCLFIPLGASYSLDRALDSSENAPPITLKSVGSLGLKIAVLMLGYFLLTQSRRPAGPGALSMLLIFIPSLFWKTLLEWTATPRRTQTTVFYDADCSFCKKSMRIIQTFLLHPGTVVRPAQEEPSILKEMHEHNSWVVVDPEGKRLIKFDAFVWMCQISPWLGGMAFMLKNPLIRRWGNKAYEQTASHRMQASSVLRFLVFRPQTYNISSLNNAVALVSLAVFFFAQLPAPYTGVFRLLAVFGLRVV